MHLVFDQFFYKDKIMEGEKTSQEPKIICQFYQEGKCKIHCYSLFMSVYGVSKKLAIIPS